MTTPDIALTTTLEPKTKLSGKVLKTTLAGALVDVGQSIPGVIHISQLSTEPVNKVEDVVKEGQTVDVWVRRVKKDRIELTMIEPLALEWKEIEPDMVVKGKVVRLEAYGAFVDIGAERPGMVHVSELAHGYVKTPNEIVKEGDEVEAKVLDVNRKKKQIKLSMKALEPDIEEFKPLLYRMQHQRVGCIARPAACRHVDAVEDAEGIDGAQRQRQQDRRQHERNDDDPQTLQRRRSIHFRCLENIARQCLQAGEQDQRHEWRTFPDVDEDKGC